METVTCCDECPMFYLKTDVTWCGCSDKQAVFKFPFKQDTSVAIACPIHKGAVALRIETAA